MGTWGTGSFDSDGASDWLYDLESASGLELLYSTLDEVVGLVPQAYLDARDAENAIAAAEVVATLRGRPAPSQPDSLRNWLEANYEEPPTDLIDKALRAIQRVQSPPSELLELWEESAEFSAWQGFLEDLERRLKA